MCMCTCVCTTTSESVSVCLEKMCVFMKCVPVYVIIMFLILPLLGFDSLQKAFHKAKTVIDKEPETPRFYIRALMELEDFIKDVSLYRIKKSVYCNRTSVSCVFGV